MPLSPIFFNTGEGFFIFLAANGYVKRLKERLRVHSLG